MSAYGNDTKKHRRNQVLLILMYDSGCRVQELSDLKVSSLHLDVSSPYMTVIGKGKIEECATYHKNCMSSKNILMNFMINR